MSAQALMECVPKSFHREECLALSVSSLGWPFTPLPSPGVSALTFIPVSRFSVPWKKLLWKHPPSSFYTLKRNEQFSWLAVEQEQSNPAWGILMPHFFHTPDAVKSMQIVLISIAYNLQVSKDPALQRCS